MRRLVIGSLLCAGIAAGQVITTVAGTNYVVPRAGVLAVDAPLGRLTGVAVDKAGVLYAVDNFDNIVVQVSTKGLLTVIAGNGFAGFSGDGGPATNASLNAPSDVVVDSAGNLYIADTGNNRIRKVSQGVITTVAGNGFGGFSGDNGAGSSASLNSPRGMVLDSAGSLYIADFLNNRIRRLAGGTITTVVGNGTAGFAGDAGPAANASLNNPHALAMDAAGSLYIADSANYRIRKVSGGTISTVAGNGTRGLSGDGGPAVSASIGLSRGVAVDTSGNLYIGDSDNSVVRKVSGGTITRIAGGGGGLLGDGGPATSANLQSPWAVTLDGTGNLYIADLFHGRIRKVSAGTISTVVGNGGFAGDAGSSTSAILNSPESVAVDRAGNLYIADYLNHRVRKVSGGNISTVAGNGTAGFSGDGGPAASASLNGPWSIALDSAGALYIAEYNGNRIRKVAGGTITTVAGNGRAGFSGDGGLATDASLNTPESIAVDANGTLYIADTANSRIRKVFAGTISTVAGNGVAGFTGDGGPAVNASLNFPGGVTLDATGTLYISDSFNHRVRMLSGETIKTVVGNGTPGFSGDGGLALNASLREPVGLAVDSAGNLYVGDFTLHIRKVSGGVISTVAGNGARSPLGDGGDPTKAAVDTTGGIALDSGGNLYIADPFSNRVRVLLSAKPAYQVSPAALTFSAVAGGKPTAAQAISLSSVVSGLSFSAATNASWLTVSPAAGSLPSTLQVTADPSSLAAGQYQATITITVPLATPATTTVAVTFTVQAAPAAQLAVDTQSVSLTAVQRGGPVSQQLSVLNTGAGSLTFTASASTSSGGSWLSLTAAEGSASAGSPASLAVVATPGSLDPGTYQGTVKVTGGGSSITIPVTLSIAAPAASILLSQSALSFTGVAQGGVPLPKNFGILNTGQGSMSWTATANTLSGGNWLAILPSSGTVERPYLDVSLVSVSIDPTTLPAGSYYGQIAVSAVASNTPQVITVILTVLPPGTALGAEIYPASLIFTGVAGVTPGSQDVQVANPSAGAISFVSGIIGGGLDYLPKSAGIAPDQPTTLHVYPDFSSLMPGTIQKGTITLQFSDASLSQTINVLTVVAPPGTVPAAHARGRSAPASSGCAAPGLFVVFRSPQPAQTTFTARVGEATTLEVQVSDACGNLLTPGGQSASVKASFSNSDSLSMVHIGNGTWQSSWRPAKPGTVSMFVTAFAVTTGDAILAGQSPTLTASVTTPTAAATPLVTAEGVVHAASDLGGVPIAPGGLITVYGQNLADATGSSKGLPLPDQLNGTQVLLGTQKLPILYTNPGQLNVQVPYGVPVNTQYQLTVQRANTYSAPQSLVVAQAQPGIFTVSQTGSGQGSIVKSDGVTLAQPGTPAAIGEVVVIYCTGLGAVTPTVPAGVAPPSVPPLSNTVNPVTVTIGGKPAQVTFAGLTPGSPGLYQINAVVPAGVAADDAVPVVISVAGQTSPISPPVTMAVK